MTPYTYGIKSRWNGDHSSPSELGDNFLGTIEALRPVDPAMNNWRLLDASTDPVSEVKLSDEVDHIALWVERNPDEDGRNPWRPSDGYCLRGWSSLVYSEVTTPQTVKLRIIAGTTGLNEANFHVGGMTGPADEAMLTYPIFRGALDAMVSNWPCPFASAYAVNVKDGPPVPVIRSQADFDRMLAEPWKPTPTLFLQWIVYLSAPLAAGFFPPADLTSERTPGGGLILSATKDNFDPANRDHFQQALRLTAIMDALVPSYNGSKRTGEIPPRVGPY